MSGPRGRNDRSTAAPSDPLDAALADLTEARESLSADARDKATRAAMRPPRETELEADDDDETDEGTPSTTEPEDDDIEDIEDDEDDDEDNEVERRTAADDDEDDDDESQDVDEAPRAKAKTSPESKKKPGDRQPKQTERDSDDDDDEPRLSRKQRGRLIEELRKQLDAEQQERVQLQQRQKQLEEQDTQLESEVRRALGSDEEYEKAMEDGLRGDESAAERARIWKANRAFYNKLVHKARRDVQSDFTKAYWATVSEIPGVDQEVLSKASLPQVLKHLYEVGTKNQTDEAQERIDELESEVETWKGKYQSLKARVGSGKRSPVTGGGQAPAPKKKTLQSLLDPITGLPTDEAENLVLQKGFGAVFGNKKQRAQVR